MALDRRRLRPAVLLDLGPVDDRSPRWLLGMAAALVLLCLFGIANVLLLHDVFAGVACFSRHACYGHYPQHVSTIYRYTEPGGSEKE